MEDNNMKKEVNKKTSYKKRVILVIIFLLLFAIYEYINLRGQYLNILEIGEQYTSIFTTNLKFNTLIIGVNFIIIYFFMYITTRIIKKGLKKFFEAENMEFPKLPNKSISLIVSVIFSILVSNTIAEKILLAFNSTRFEVLDPIFKMDISYFMFQKPFIELIIIYVGIIVLGLTIYTAIYYIVTFNVYFDGIDTEMLKKSSFVKQLLINIMIIVVCISGYTLIKTQDIVYDKFLTIKLDTEDTVITGAGIVDVTIKLWGYRILAVLMIISAFLAIKYFKQSKAKNVIISLSIVPIYLVALFIIMVGFDLIFVSPNQLDKEKKYIAYNIDSTKNAYNIQMEEKKVENSGTITNENVTSNEEIINNIPIIDKNITLQTLEEYQGNNGYYSYKNTQIGNYKIDSEYSLIYVTPREIISGADRTYNNKTYEYTHGFGSIISSATTPSETGSIEYIQKNFKQDDEKIKISEPRIYFGLETNETIITNTKNKTEYDYPITNSKNAEFNYDGKAGLELGFLDRFILGIKKGDFNLAFGVNMSDNSKVLINRNIIKRAKTLMPYLLYDENPYMVITDEGRQVWVLDAYTTSNMYPYSQSTTIEKNGMKTKINYIRNSVKVLIDSYDGTVKFYITDRTDPIAMAYRNIYSSLFIDESIPEDIQKHIVYPEFLYNIQAEMLRRYHDVQTEVLYRNDDVWDIARSNTSKTTTTLGTKMEPYYVLTKKSDSTENTLGLIIPYTPYSKQNITAYLVGTYENNSNKLIMYRFNSDSNILGPMQLDKQIEQDETISNAIDSINVTGTRIIKNMLIVPIENTLLYVEPIYQVYVNEKSQIPILKKVIVASGNKLAIGDNFKDALTNLVSKEAVNIEVENTDNVEDLVKAIIRANNNIKASSANSDWELVGKDMGRLQKLIEQLEVLIEENETNTITDEKNNTLINNQNSIINY